MDTRMIVVCLHVVLMSVHVLYVSVVIIEVVGGLLSGGGRGGVV